ncbi:hypothetical protein GCM10009582_27800 [Arthrobacter flavus]
MKTLENLPIPGFIADPEWGNRWNICENQPVSVNLNDSGNFSLTKVEKFTLHTVLNAEVSDLEVLSDGQGVPVSQNTSYTVALNARTEDRVHVQLVIHEFDSSGTRTSRLPIENLERVLYVPVPGTASLVISLRTTGRGTMTVRGVEFNRASAITAAPGLHKHGVVVEPAARSKAQERDPYVWLLPLRRALYDGTPLSVLFTRKEAVEAVKLFIDGEYMLEAKEIIQHFDLYSDLTTSQLRRIFWHGRRTGYLVHAIRALDEVVFRTQSVKDSAARDLLNAEYEFHRDPWGMLPDLAPASAFDPAGPVLHFVGKALPEKQTGYTVRTRYTTEALSAGGTKCIIAVQVGGNHEDGLDEEVDHTFGNVRTVMLAGPSKNKAARSDWMRRNAEELYTLVTKVRPSVIHAHSDFTNGALATHVASATGVPVVYEARGFWEETWLSRIAKAQSWDDIDLHMRMYGAPELYELRRQSERRVRERADRVITLAETMKRFILEESPGGAVKSEHITLARNAVDPEDFPPPTGPSSARETLGIDDHQVVVGYISSIVEYEGIETLLDGYKKLSDTQENVHLLIVGDGPHLNRLRTHAEKNSIPNVVFTGRIPHEEVLSYYHAIDIFVVPRRRTRVTELVTPLKPFEAFSTGRAVVMSDVAALVEIAQDSAGAARIFAADNPDSLAQVLTELVEDPAQRRQMGERGTRWVKEKRSWSSNVPAYQLVYNDLKRERSVVS